MAEAPGALQLRYLQTLNTIAGEKNSTIVFPLPLEIMNAITAIGKAVGPSLLDMGDDDDGDDDGVVDIEKGVRLRRNGDGDSDDDSDSSSSSDEKKSEKGKKKQR